MVASEKKAFNACKITSAEGRLGELEDELADELELAAGTDGGVTVGALGCGEDFGFSSSTTTFGVGSGTEEEEAGVEVEVEPEAEVPVGPSSTT